MPIYAFQCCKCGHAFDRLQKMSDPDPDACPACAAHAVRRQVTAPSFRLSGSGWYETDFKKDGDRKRNLTESGDGAEGKSEAKVEAKAESGDAKASGSAAEPAAKAAPDKAPAASGTPKVEPKPAAKPATPAGPSA